MIQKIPNITDAQLKERGVQALSNRPNLASQYGKGGMTPEELKKWFDNLAFFLKDEINKIHDVLYSKDAAKYINTIALDEWNISSLQDLLEAITNGQFAQVLQVSRSPSNVMREPLQGVLYWMLSDISECKNRLAKAEESFNDADANAKLSAASAAAAAETANQAAKTANLFAQDASGCASQASIHDRSAQNAMNAAKGYAEDAAVAADRVAAVVAHEAYYCAMEDHEVLSDDQGKICIIPRNVTMLNGTALDSDLLNKAKNCAIVVLPNGCENIADKFFETAKLQTVRISPTTTSIGEYAFNLCSELKRVVLPDSVVEIKNAAFQGCSSLVDFVLGRGITEIPGNIFYNCTALHTVKLTEQIETISANAFVKWYGLTKIHIPKSVTRIGNTAFAHCTGLFEITVDPENTVYHADGCCLIHTADKRMIAGCRNSVIPSDGSVTTLGKDCFYGQKGIATMYLPEAIKVLEAQVFKSCTNLAVIRMPGVTDIGSKVFAKLSTDPDEMQLTDVLLPATIISIASDAFAGSSLERIYCRFSKDQVDSSWESSVPDGGVVHYIGADEIVTVSSPFNSLTLYNSGKTDNTRVVEIADPNTYVTFGYGSFSQCKKLSFVEFPKEYEIGLSAFADDIGLVNLNINPQGTIGNQAFRDCTGLKCVVIGDNTEGIDYKVFWGCTQLEYVKLGPNVVSIGSQAFDAKTTTSVKLTVDMTIYGEAIPFPELDAGAFDNREQLEIRVPFGRTGELAKKTNWSTWADYMVEV